MTAAHWIVIGWLLASAFLAVSVILFVKRGSKIPKTDKEIRAPEISLSYRNAKVGQCLESRK